jgi:hypothetical protein
MMDEASKRHPILPSVFDKALSIGLRELMEHRDKTLELQLKSQEDTGRVFFVQPELQHRLVGEAKAMFDDLYS